MTQSPLPGLFASRTIARDCVVSTMDEARAQALAGAPHGTTVTALQQTGGRGRHGKTWVSAPGAGLWLTTLLCPPAGLDVSGLTLCMGAGVLRALWALGAVEAGIKWPNDIVVGERKLAGVLTERLEGAAPRVLVGVGVNVAPTAPGALRQSDPEAAARYVGLLALCPEVTLPKVRHVVTDALEQAYDSFCAQGMGPTLALFDRAHVLQGLQVRAHNSGGRDTVGEVTGIAPDGGLQLACAEGPTTIYAGEVARVRAVRR